MKQTIPLLFFVLGCTGPSVQDTLFTGGDGVSSSRTESAQPTCDLGYWMFNGESQDHLGCNNPLSGPAVYTGVEGGISDQGLSLDQTPAPLTIEDGAASLDNESFTIGLWFKGDPVQPSWALILHRGNFGAPPWTSYRLQFNDQNTLAGHVGLTNDTEAVVELPGVNDGTWHHVAITFKWDPTMEQGTLSGYVDGVRTETATGFAPIRYGSVPFSVRGSDDFVPVGTIDQLAVLDFPLNSDWIGAMAADHSTCNYDVDLNGNRFETETPSYAVASHAPSLGLNSSGGARMDFGGVDANEVHYMSGGLGQELYLPDDVYLTFSYDYSLFATLLQPGEFVWVLVVLDGDYTNPLATESLGGDGSAEQATGWQNANERTEAPIPSGHHTITLFAGLSHKDSPDQTATVVVDNFVIEKRTPVSITQDITYGAGEDVVFNSAVVELNGRISLVDDARVKFFHSGIVVDQGGEHQKYWLRTFDNSTLEVEGIDFREVNGSWYNWAFDDNSTVTIEDADIDGQIWLSVDKNAVLTAYDAEIGVTTFGSDSSVFAYDSYAWLEYALPARPERYDVRTVNNEYRNSFTYDEAAHVYVERSVLRFDVSTESGVDLLIYDSDAVELGWVFHNVGNSGAIAIDDLTTGYFADHTWDPGLGHGKLTFQNVNFVRWWPSVWGPYDVSIDNATTAEAEAWDPGSSLTITNSNLQRVGAHNSATTNVSDSIIQRDATAQTGGTVNLTNITPGPDWVGCFEAAGTVNGCPP